MPFAPYVAQRGCGGLPTGQLFQWFLCTGHRGCQQHPLDNIWLAAPLIIPQLHIDHVVLADSQLLQVTAFVPGGDTLISSRSLTMIEKRNRVFTILDSMLRQRFTDMRYVGFLLLTAHPSKWMDPAFSPQKEKVVVVYSEEVLQGSASVLLRLSLPPHDAEGAIYVRRRLRLRYLISPLCGDDGDECLCYVNGMELTNDGNGSG